VQVCYYERYQSWSDAKLIFHGSFRGEQNLGCRGAQSLEGQRSMETAVIEVGN
jgi:hypothetical protein